MRNYTQILNCIGHQLSFTTDSADHIWPIIACHNCNDKVFCLRIKRIIDDDVNRILTLGDRILEIARKPI